MKSIRYRLIVCIAVAAAAGPAFSAGTIPQELRCPSCNVIFITIDELRSDELKIGGSPTSIMPALDALAARGVAFTNAYSPAPDTFPTDFTLMSGLEPWNHGVLLQLRDEQRRGEWLRSGRTLPAILKRHGYELYKKGIGSSVLRQLVDKQYEAGRSVEVKDLGKGKKFFLWLKSEIHDPYYPQPETVRSLNIASSLPKYPDRDIVNLCVFASLASATLPVSAQSLGDVTMESPDHDRVRRLVSIADPQERLAAFRGYDTEQDWYGVRSRCFWSFFPAPRSRRRGFYTTPRPKRRILI